MSDDTTEFREIFGSFAGDSNDAFPDDRAEELAEVICEREEHLGPISQWPPAVRNFKCSLR